MKFKSFALEFRRGGLSWMLFLLRNRFFPSAPSFRPLAAKAITGKKALEIGGPSRVFAPSRALPAYKWASQVDNINFNHSTSWEAGLVDGGPFPYHRGRSPGIQHLREASQLRGLEDGSYEAILSSHCLEHLANPIGALREWHRVAGPGAPLLLLVPDPRHTFDHARPVTTFQHLVEDDKNSASENDDTHFEEVLRLHDLAMDPLAGDRDEFTRRVRENGRHRCVHHHVFDEALLKECLLSSGWSPVACEAFGRLHLAALAFRTG